MDAHEFAIDYHDYCRALAKQEYKRRGHRKMIDYTVKKQKNGVVVFKNQFSTAGETRQQQNKKGENNETGMH